jgi:hypothetical protein
MLKAKDNIEYTEKAKFCTEKYTKHTLVFKFLLLLQHE